MGSRWLGSAATAPGRCFEEILSRSLNAQNLKIHVSRSAFLWFATGHCPVWLPDPSFEMAAKVQGFD